MGGGGCCEAQRGEGERDHRAESAPNPKFEIEGGKADGLASKLKLGVTFEASAEAVELTLANVRY